MVAALKVSLAAAAAAAAAAGVTTVVVALPPLSLVDAEPPSSRHNIGGRRKRSQRRCCCWSIRSSLTELCAGSPSSSSQYFYVARRNGTAVVSTTKIRKETIAELAPRRRISSTTTTTTSPVTGTAFTETGRIHTPLVLHTKTAVTTPYRSSTSRWMTQLRGGGGGGGGDDPDVAAILTKLHVRTVVNYAAAAVLAGATVALVRQVPRSGGHAPRLTRWVRTVLPWVSPNAVAILFHLAYVAHAVMVWYCMPERIRDIVFSPGGVILLGTVFPIVESIRAAGTDSVADDNTWLQYWIMHGIFSYSTEFVDQIAERYPWVGQHWYALEFYLILWLVLPFTDGAAIVYELGTKPYLVPLVKPVVQRCEGWLTTVALTLVNASHVWFVSIFFLALPTVLKRLAVIVTGTAFPVLATVVAVSTHVDGDDTQWLTYWASFSCLYLVLHSVEQLVGCIPGLYTASLAATLYLMLPIFNGKDQVYRKIWCRCFDSERHCY